MMNWESVREFIRREVPDWDDEIVSTARFKAFSGQRSDWEPRYHFWKDSILRVARRFDLLIIQPSQLKKEWLNRGGLIPLCIDDVLDKAFDVIEHLSESNWTSTCVVTMRRFEEICGGRDKASAILSYLSGYGKAGYLCHRKKEVIEGVKVSLSSDAASSVSSLDYDVLHLVWTVEKLHQQLDVIDRRYEKSRSSAIVSLKSGNRKIALRHARELKLASESRDKCVSLLNRVEEVLNVISNAESTRKVSEAIQIGARAMKENKISVEEVELCLEEIDDSIESQKQVEKALESASFTAFEDGDVEDEFSKLELEIENSRDEQYTHSRFRCSGIGCIFSRCIW